MRRLSSKAHKALTLLAGSPSGADEPLAPGPTSMDVDLGEPSLWKRTTRAAPARPPSAREMPAPTPIGSPMRHGRPMSSIVPSTAGPSPPVPAGGHDVDGPP